MLAVSFVYGFLKMTLTNFPNQKKMSNQKKIYIIIFLHWQTFSYFYCPTSGFHKTYRGQLPSSTGGTRAPAPMVLSTSAWRGLKRQFLIAFLYLLLWLESSSSWFYSVPSSGPDVQVLVMHLISRIWLLTSAQYSHIARLQQFELYYYFFI